jgi:hypothetical protein
MEQKAAVSCEQSRQGRSVLWLCIGLVLALRLAASFSIPFGRNVEHHLEGLNDEPSHFNYIKYCALHRAFPVLEHNVMEPDAFVRNEFEYHQAPLYYLLCAPFYRLFGENGAFAAGRLLSVFFGIAGLCVIALILRDCGLPARVQQAAVLFVGLLPSHLYFTVLVSNDALSWLFALLLTRALLRYGMLADSAAVAAGTSVMMALYLAAGAMTKSSLLILFPAAAGVFLYKYFISKNRTHLVQGALVLGTSGAAILPWYVRNLVLYHSLLGTPSSPGDAFFTLQGLYGFLTATDKYFWFPMQHLHGGTAAYFVLCAVGAAVITVHALAAVWYFVKDGRRSFPAAALLFIFLLNAVAYAWYFFFTKWGNPEARFLFPAIASIAFFFIIPAYDLFTRLNLERFFLPYILVVSLFPYPFLFFTG